ncbi:anthranilate phosphoribosyltransferase [Desulfogranum mediterraneum]|uniref:anthranilate phosphoribosyltransferase n=1 Tax=Desulfogranum mediterraneum TaxID=160661 RepID=UPI0003F984F0|nr:anthranilate phosphoribosyltransferase [Desulfogranum mediterraneum]
MDHSINRQFGQLISRLIAGEHLSAEESYQAFCMVVNNEVTEMQQGAFLAALTGKGETAEEVAGGWKAIYELDTAKVALNRDLGLVDNCGTGMDSFKTFNISTAASILAAAGGVRVARHGARAISSVCGTVDMAEALGVDVECDVSCVARSIEEAGLGLFNGMSPKVHPVALGRILSQIHFGSPLNIAASLANPALPRMGVRGVYAKELIMPVARVMQTIGYTDATVIYGTITDSDQGMDEASVCGPTYGARLRGGEIHEFTLRPEACGLVSHAPDPLAADPDREQAALRMVALLHGRDDAVRRDALLLNTALLFELTGKTASIEQGVALAEACLNQGKAITTLSRWVRHQNRDPEQGLARLQGLIGQVQ